MRRQAPVAEITIYGRRDCHLCDEAGAAVARAGAGLAVRITHVDVDADPILARQYGDVVPVVAVNGHRMFKVRVDPELLRRRLLSLQHGHAEGDEA